MIKLSVPLQRKEKSLKKMTAVDLFVHCVNGYAAEAMRDHLLNAKQPVEKDSADYQSLVSLERRKTTALPNGIVDKEMVNVYEYQLVRKDSVGRPYYDAILNHAKNDLCPYCGVQTVTTLDHYLPKHEYPTLVVAPMNLIPCCMNCNHIKLNGIPASCDGAPIHSYLDVIPNAPWLHVKLGEHLEATYYVECPTTWDPLLSRRLENHVDKFKLKRLYRNQAAVEISNSCFLWNKALEISEEMLFCLLRTTRESIEDNGENYWKAALYRSLEEHMDVLIAYLRSKSWDKRIESDHT